MPFFDAFKERFPDAEPYVSKDGHESVSVPNAQWRAAAEWLRDHAFPRFIDLTCVDEPETPERFEVHLVVYSMSEKRWARLVTRTDEELDSLFPVFQGVHNYEREVFDLFGVQFQGHPRLTRIVLPDGWQGHPLQRDHPVSIEPTDFTVTRDLYKT